MNNIFAGIKTILVSLMAQKAEVKYDPAYVLPSQIVNKVSEIGFSASLLEGETAGQGVADLRVSLDLVLSLLLTERGSPVV